MLNEQSSISKLDMNNIDKYLYSGKNGTKVLLICAVAITVFVSVLFSFSNPYLIREKRLSKTMTVYINTDDGRDPTCVEIEAPEGCTGRGIITNEYVHGELIIRRDGIELLKNELSIRVRGNTSAHSDNNVKNPYKLKLEKPTDLLFRKNETYKDTEWILLQCDNLNTQVGIYVSKLSGIEWEPEYAFVNLVLNGDWKGSYLLIESVKKAEGRINIEDTGFIVENDAYWWKPGTVYFKTENQNTMLGYTFKYPDINSNYDFRIKQIQSYFKITDELLTEHSDKIWDYVDADSFASWLLAKDILGAADSLGSNMYCYKESANELSKLKAGPAWDFDWNYEQREEWSGVHLENESSIFKTYIYDFPCLLTYDEFCKVYTEKWNMLSGTLYDSVDAFLTEMYREQGDDIQYSFVLESQRWRKDIPSLLCQMEDVKKWMSERTDWIDCNVNKIRRTSGSIELINNGNEARITMSITDACDAVKFAVWSEKNGQDDIIWYDAVNEDEYTWIAISDLNNHGDYGEYHLHVYYEKDGKQELKYVTVFNR